MKKALFVLGGLTASALTFAQSTTAAFGTAITSVSANVVTFGGALIGVAAVGVGFMVGMKYVKKIRGAA